MEVLGGTEQPIEDPASEEVNASKGGCNTIGSPWLGSWQELWTNERMNPCWSRFTARTCDPMGDPSWSRLFLRDCTTWKGPPWEKFVKNFSPYEGLTLDNFMDGLPGNISHAGAVEQYK